MSSSFGKFVIGAFVGGAVGALVGMLMAPDKGKNTRDRIGQEINNRYEGSVDSVREKVDMVKEKTDEVIAKTGQLKEEAAKITQELEQVGRKTIQKMTEKNT